MRHFGSGSLCFYKGVEFYLKRIIFVVLSSVSVLLFFAANFLLKIKGTVSSTISDGKVTINVCNWGEFISDGSDDLLDVNEEFTRRTGIRVNYTTFQSNEDLFAKLENKAIQYDVIIPSDYMVDRLIKSKLIKKLDFSIIKNVDLVEKQLKNLNFDPTGEYSIVYAWGVVVLIYNKKVVKINKKDIDWDVLWNKEFRNKILMFNNPRDAFAVSQFKLGIDLNSSNKKDWLTAFYDLKAQREVVQGYVMDQIFDKMSSEEAFLAPYYLGDALTLRGINPNLGIVIPKSGTNKFLDAMCVPSNSSHPKEAMMYINFMCDPEISSQNSKKIKYFSPIAGVNKLEEIEDVENSEKIMDPGFTKGFTDLDENTKHLLSNLWTNLKLDEKNDWHEFFIVIIALILLVILALKRRIRSNVKKCKQF